MSSMAVQMARHLGAAGRMEENLDRAVTIRPASTAAFMVDSKDRADAYPSSGSFQITKQQNLFTGFFSRLALQEIVLDYGIPNVFDALPGDDPISSTATFTINVVIAPNPVATITVTLPTGFYTVEEALDELVVLLNAATAPGTFVVTYAPPNPQVSLDITGAGNSFEIVETNLSASLFNEKQLDAGQHTGYIVTGPRLLPYSYLDFVCSNLTYNQDLKDNDTSTNSKDVLYRWYFGWDTPVEYDGYGFPIQQGYRPFIQRRLISYPKQILWNKAQPIGSLLFEVYDESDRIVDPEKFPVAPIPPSTVMQGGAEMEFEMTMLITEN